MKQSLPAKTEDSSASHSSHLSCLNSVGQHRELMMTCHIAVVMSDGYLTKAQTLLDCTLSTSFITEHLARHLQYQHVQITGIGVLERSQSSRSEVTLTVNFLKSLKISRLSGPQWKVQVAVLPQIIAKLLAMTVSLDMN